MSIFNKIINREIPANIVYENKYVIAFKDINPLAPIHILVVPKKEIRTLNDFVIEDSIYITEIFLPNSLVFKSYVMLQPSIPRSFVVFLIW